MEAVPIHYKYLDACVLQCPDITRVVGNDCVLKCPINAIPLQNSSVCSYTDCSDINAHLLEDKCVMACPGGTDLDVITNKCVYANTLFLGIFYL